MQTYRLFAYTTILSILTYCAFAISPLTKSHSIASKSISVLDEARQARIQTFVKTWPDTPDYTVTFSALSDGGNISSSANNAVFNPNDDYFGLPQTGAFEDIANYCGACHSLQIVMQQKASKPRWEYMLNWMVSKQGMSPLPEDTREEILVYLSENFGP